MIARHMFIIKCCCICTYVYTSVMLRGQKGRIVIYSTLIKHCIYK